MAHKINDVLGRKVSLSVDKSVILTYPPTNKLDLKYASQFYKCTMNFYFKQMHTRVSEKKKKKPENLKRKSSKDFWKIFNNSAKK